MRLPAHRAGGKARGDSSRNISPHIFNFIVTPCVSIINTDWSQLTCLVLAAGPAGEMIKIGGVIRIKYIDRRAIKVFSVLVVWWSPNTPGVRAVSGEGSLGSKILIKEL